MAPPLEVCIDARVRYGEAGGVEQVILGLAHGLSQLDGESEHYRFLAYSDSVDWLRPYLGGSTSLLLIDRPPLLARRAAFGRALPAAVRPALQRGVLPFFTGARPAQSDGTIERAGVDVVQFPTQMAFATRVPSIYHPHDLQHIHLPQFFTRAERYQRERLYRFFCRQAAIVSVASIWSRDDVIAQYGLPSEKVALVPLAPATRAYAVPTADEVRAFGAARGLPEAFVFYPAQTWPHKNHLTLLEAIATIRERDSIAIPLVSSGRLTEHHHLLRRRASDLGIADLVRFLDFVNEHELQCLYRLARAVVIPTLFEAGSLPMWEAFLAGTAVACSNITSLPAQAADAALIFDPRDVAQVADAVLRLWTDDALRRDLIARGTARVAAFTWHRTARMFRALYRRVAGRAMTEEDRALLAAPPLM